MNLIAPINEFKYVTQKHGQSAVKMLINVWFCKSEADPVERKFSEICRCATFRMKPIHL